MTFQGVIEEKVVVSALECDSLGQATSQFIKTALLNLPSTLHNMGVSCLYVVDSAYFKLLTKETKAKPHYGYALPCKIDGYAEMTAVFGASYQALIHNPTVQY
jgi:DNA polymerase-1